jgi:hypothetical protein
MADFGTADGVLGLLRTEAVGLVAWIHILAFDQVVGHLIYRDNMKHRFVPVVVQSVILVLVFMLGPLGFLLYWLIRVVRGRRLVAWSDPAELPDDPGARPVRFSDVVQQRSVAKAVVGLLRRESALTRVGLLGFALAGVCAVVALLHGDWQIGTEGRLKEAIRFDLAIGIFNLTLALLLPLAGLSPAVERRWRRWEVGLTILGYGMENVQAWRGLDPRFSAVGGPADQILGGVFFLQALAIFALFAMLVGRFFRGDVLLDHPALKRALRYGAIGSYAAFFVGVLMVSVQGRIFNEGGDLIAIHAAGFHSLQAVPLVALLLGWSRVAAATALRLVDVAGSGWLLFCFALLLQALLGLPTAARTAAFGLGVLGVGTWGVALFYAWWARRSEPALATS